MNPTAIKALRRQFPHYVRPAGQSQPTPTVEIDILVWSPSNQPDTQVVATLDGTNIPQGQPYSDPNGHLATTFSSQTVAGSHVLNLSGGGIGSAPFQTGVPANDGDRITVTVHESGDPSTPPSVDVAQVPNGFTAAPVTTPAPSTTPPPAITRSTPSTPATTTGFARVRAFFTPTRTVLGIGLVAVAGYGIYKLVEKPKRHSKSR